MVGQLFSLLSAFISSLFNIEIVGIPMYGWYVLFWILAVVGWILQAMYGRGDK